MMYPAPGKINWLTLRPVLSVPRPGASSLACGASQSPRTLGARGLLGRSAPAGGAALPGARVRMTRKRALGCGRAALAAQGSAASARPGARRRTAPMRLRALRIVARSLFPRSRRSLAPTRRRQFHSRSASLGKSNRDRLLGRASSVLAFPNMIHLLPHEFARLGAGRLAFPCILAGSLKCLFFRHVYLLARAVQFFFRIPRSNPRSIFVTVTDSLLNSFEFCPQYTARGPISLERIPA